MELVLVKRTKGWSQLNNCSMERYGWYDVDKKEYYESTVDASYSNYIKNGWANMATAANVLGVYGGLNFALTKGKIRVTADGKCKIISADSTPNLITRLTEQQMLDIVNLAESQ